MCEVHNIQQLKERTYPDFPDVEVIERDLGNEAFLSILRGGLGRSDAESYMDAAVSEYVRHSMFNQFTEIFNDNPYVRVLIFGFNNLQGWTSFREHRR